MSMRFGLAVLLPLLALALQWLLWPWLDPFVWFLFFPAVFFSARLGGLWPGLASTALSVGLVWFFFIAPPLSWKLDHPPGLYSVVLFLAMGYLFSDSQERLRRAQRNLVTALAEMRAANEKVSELHGKSLQLDELKTQFFTNVSHELRTPLTLIMSPLAQRLAAPGTPEALRREDEMMLRSARVLYRHVSDLLDIAKLESGHRTVHYARVDIGVLTRTMASQFESLARDKGITYGVDVSAPLHAEADAERVQRILLNLLSNAFKFTPPGGGIQVRLRQEAEEAVVEVQDNGPGVPADLHEQVFERFHQVGGGGMQRHFGGAGLGLAIVKQFADLHGGSATVSEPPGGGARFTVRLPLKAPAGAVIESTASRLDPVIDRQTLDELRPVRRPSLIDTTALPDAQAGANAPLVLVVEDNVDMSTFIAEALRPRYRVACAFDGQEGLERAMALQPDLILCDVLMPRLSGDLLILEARRRPALANVPIVMLTMKGDEALHVRLLKNGAQDCLDKPFGVDELLARVAGLISERKRSQAELQRYEQIVATSGDMLLFIDRQHRFVVTNPAYAALYSTRPAELRERLVADVIGAAAYARIGPRLDRALAGESQRFIAEPEFPDGRYRVLDAEYRPFVSDGEVQGVVVSLRDITELKASDAALAASEERLRLALEASDDGLWDWDLRSGAVHRSERYYALAGFRPDQASPDFDFFKRLVHPDDLPRVMQIIETHRQGKSPAIEYEFRRVDPAGATRWMRVRGRAVERDALGLPLRIAGTITDIHASKAAEEALRLQTEELAKRNAELERFNRATVGRELDMIALKQQVNALSSQLGRAAPFALAFGEVPDPPASNSLP
jgi:PAS domain S-box-containing protein